MINGVMNIVAAVLFAMVYLFGNMGIMLVYLFGNMGIMWLWIGAAYLVLGILNLAAYAARNHKKQKQSAREAAKEAAKQAEAADAV